MASASKTKLIAGAWTAVGGIAAVTTYRRMRGFEDRTPCFQEAVRELSASSKARDVLGSGEWRVASWPKQGAVDLSAGKARASFEVRGSEGSAFVMMGTSRQRSAQEAWEASQEDDEDAAELSGWRYYWSKPWELKFRILEKLRGLQQGGNNSDVSSGWDIDTLFFLPNGDAQRSTVLIGDPRAVPEYEAICARRDADSKDDKSRRRLYGVLGLATAGALLAAGLRLRRSLKVSKSYGFVRRSVLAHNDVVALMGPNATIQSSSGTFNPTYINANLRLVSNNGKVADVDVAATRDGVSGSPWRVMLARMSLGGGLAHNLDKSQF